MRTLSTPDGAMDLFVAEPAGEPKGGIVVIQEAFGLTSHIEDVCHRLAHAGWLAIAPAIYHRTGAPVLGYDRMDEVPRHFLAVDIDGLATDIGAALATFDEAGIEPSRRGVIGFCMGGTIAVWSATVFDLGAAVTFYGGGILAGRMGMPPLVELAPALRAPWQGHFGDDDSGIPVDEVEQLRSAASQSAVESEVHRYPDAPHGFNCDERDAYHEPSATLAWQRSLDWFDRHLAP